VSQQSESKLLNTKKSVLVKPPPSSVFPTIIGITAIIFALDQVTKFLVIQNIPKYQSLTILPGFDRLFKFTFVTNTGAAFGMLPQLGDAFTIIAFLVLFFLLTSLYYNLLPTENVWVRVSVGLLLGGVMGNGLDRIVRGYVVDFVDIGFWPIFNIADLAIICGVAILAYHLWDEEERATESSSLSSI